MSDLSELAERVEALDGPDREVDCLIGVAIGWFITEPNKGWPDRLDYIDVRGIWETTGSFAELVPKFTSSLDAAMTLVPEDMWLEMHGPRRYLNIPTVSPNYWSAKLEAMGSNARASWGKTPALALAAAALRARSKDMREEYRLIQDGETVVCSISLQEIRRYAAVYSQDGPVTIQCRDDEGRWRNLAEEQVT